MEIKFQLFSLLIIFFNLIEIYHCRPQAIINNSNKSKSSNDIVPSCSNPVYCDGELLDIVQMSGIYNDSKTFVDMSQLYDVNITLSNFRIMMNNSNNKPTKAQVVQFVNDNFISENETVDWTPPDFTTTPQFLQNITDDDVKEFAENLISIWPTLGRKVAPDVNDNPDKHSILRVPNGFIVPGGRFKELYYWDSYWIIKGLLLSEMYDTAKGMLENLCHLIDEYGFIPNGARLYYLNRSHPPLFALMVQLYMEHTNNTEWLKTNIKYVEKELKFWLNNRSLMVKKDGVSYQLAHYNSNSNTPRPESYKEDVKTCSYFETESERQYCYESLKSGAESGWDFTSRWYFDKNGGTNTNLTHIDTERVVPVDLNAILCRAFKELSNFYKILKNSEKQIQWEEVSTSWNISIQTVLYNETDGIWYDYDIKLQQHRQYFYPSNFAPLWTKAYNLTNKDEYGQRAAEFFLRNNVQQYQGGIPTTLDQTGEQWDFSNAWPPLQEFVVLGLRGTKNANATKLAELLGKRWIKANMIGYKTTNVMFEKYDAVYPGQIGGGGEYVVQKGFGWTNGVVLNFINTFYS